MVPSAAVAANGQFAPGTMLGKYELLAPIGRGGMASVILARQRGPGGFEKVVVIKVVHPHMAQDQAAIAMLLDEARLAAQISHQNVVQTYELGEAHGTFYIVMEYLPGESFNHLLRKTLREAELDPLIAAWIVGQAAEGLHAAHELRDFHGNPLGIVHRDVSPGNIVVLYNGNVKVVDFGIAKAHGRVTSTQDGILKGKYGYMPPEQIRNEALDRRADVFSLGVVLWEALAMRRLFHTDNVGATLMQVLDARRVPPSTYRPNLPPGLDEIALKALAVDPSMRFQSAAEMKQAIDDVIWQARVGPTTVEAYMTALFTDRIEQRRTLLARATRESLNEQELTALGAAFEEAHATGKSNASVVTQRPHGRPFGAQTPRRSWPLVALVAAVLGVGGAVAYLQLGGRGDEKTAAPGAPPAIPMQVANAETRPSASEAPPVASAEPRPAASEAPPVATAPEPTVAPPQPAVEPPQGPDSPGTQEELEEPAPTVKAKPAKTERRQPPPPAAPPLAKDALYKQGTTAFIKGDFPAAEKAFKQLIAADKSHAAAHRGLGYVYQRQGHNAKAVKELKAYLKLAPSAKDAESVRQRIEQMGG